jgi:hypothetical protein
MQHGLQLLKKNQRDLIYDFRFNDMQFEFRSLNIFKFVPNNMDYSGLYHM